MEAKLRVARSKTALDIVLLLRGFCNAIDEFSYYIVWKRVARTAAVIIHQLAVNRSAGVQAVVDRRLDGNSS